MEKTQRASRVDLGSALSAMPAASWVMATRVLLPTLSFIEPDTSKTESSEKAAVAACQASDAAEICCRLGLLPTLTSPMLPEGVGIVTGDVVERRPKEARILAACGVLRKTRVEVAGEAIRMARMLRELMPADAGVDALLALMLLQHSRRDARTGEEGMPVLLPDQDRSRWRQAEIAEALALLTPLVETEAPLPGRGQEFLLQAPIAAEHAVAPSAAATQWDRIAGHYAELERLTGSPVVRLNRAVAVAEASGPEAGLALLDGLEAQLPRSHRLAGVRGELFLRAGHAVEAAQAFGDAVELCANDAERSLLERRRGAALGAADRPRP
jgi:hypothetical protein